MIVNDAGIPLHPALTTALQLGLSFVPFPPVSNRLPDFKYILEQLKRKLNLRIHWAMNPFTTRANSYLSHIIPSTWNPPDYVSWGPDWDDSLLQLRQTHQTLARPNINHTTLRAWMALRSDTSICISKADKGGRLVIWKTDNYDKEALRQLEDISTYRPLSHLDATSFLTAVIQERNDLANELARGGYITRAELERVTTSSCTFPAIYFLPKIHKEKRPDTGTFSARPIISSVTGPLKPLDRYLAHLTAPLLPTIPGSLQDSTRLINDLEALNSLPPDTVLFSADVESLYPSIPWIEGIKAATRYYASRLHILLQHSKTNGHLPPPNPRLFKRILSAIIQKNVFHFKNRQWFHQICGTAMGCSISVFFANTFMYYRTKTLLDSPPRQLHYLGRYIDDIIGVWSGPAASIQELFNDTVDDNIRLTFVLGGRQLEALDLRLHLDDHNRIAFTLFRKPTDGHQFLHFHSDHPMHIKRSLPYSQLLRVRRNCSDNRDYEMEARKLLQRFLHRGYPRQLLCEAKRKAAERCRTSLLLPRNHKPRHTSDKISVILPFRRDYALPARSVITDFYSDILSSAPVTERRPYMRQPFTIDAVRFAYRIGPPLGHGLLRMLKEGRPPGRPPDAPPGLMQ